MALLEISKHEFQMTPIPLRTVRPFIMEEIILSEVAEEENIMLTDKMAIQMFLRKRVSTFASYNTYHSSCLLALCTNRLRP